MGKKYSRPELESKRQAPLAGGDPGSHGFVRTATVIVGPDDTCDFIGTTDVEIEAACAWVLANYGGGTVHLRNATYTGSVTVDENYIILEGEGWDTIIDGGVAGHAINVRGDRVKIRDLTVRTTPGGGNPFDGIYCDYPYDWLHVINVQVNGSDQNGILSKSEFGLIQGCHITDCDVAGIIVNAYLIASDNSIWNSGTYGIWMGANGDHAIINGNYILTTGDDGIFINASAENCVVDGNRINDWTNEPIDDNSNTSWVSDNQCGGDVMNSKGCSFATVQLSVTHLAGGGWVEVPDGTFPEAVTIANNEVLLRGRGWGSIIDGALVGHAIAVTADRVTIQNLQCKTTQGGTNAFDGINVSTGSSMCYISNVFVSSSDQDGIFANGTDVHCVQCYILNCDRYGIDIESTGDWSIITSTFIQTTGNDGIFIDALAADCVVHGNKILGWTNEPIDDDSGTSWVADNWCGGDVVNSKGCSFATIALAETHLGSNGWIEVPLGTWSEAVVISVGITLRGQGWGTIIDGGIIGNAVTTAGPDCVIRDLAVQTTQGQGNPFRGIYVLTSDHRARIINVRVNASDDCGIEIYRSNDVIITQCQITNCDDEGIYANGYNQLISNNIIRDAGTYGIHLENLSDDTIIHDNYIDTTGDDGIYIVANCETCVVCGNRIANWTNEPIDDNSATSIVTDNHCGGPVMNSKGCSFATIALSLTHLAGNGWVEVPVGTWPEAVDITNSNVVLRGQGWGSIIDGSAGGGTAIDVTADYVLIENLTVKTTPGGGNNYHGIYVQAGADYARIVNIFVNGSDSNGILLYGTNGIAQKCFVYDVDGIGFLTGTASYTIISECVVDTTDASGIYLRGQSIVSANIVINATGGWGIYVDDADDCVIDGNFIYDTADDGIYINNLCDNCIVDSNRIKAWTNECIDDDSGSSVIGDNDCTV